MSLDSQGSKPNLLFITRVWPDYTGSGTVMRSGITLEALAETYRVFLLVIPIMSTPPIRNPPREIMDLCAEATTYSVEGQEDPAYRNVNDGSDPQEQLSAAASSPKPWHARFATPSTIQGACRVFDGVSFDLVHVFRLYMAPFAEPFLSAASEDRPWCVLDLDDVESKTRARIAALYERNGETTRAAFERLEAQKYVLMEPDYLPRFDEVWVCSDQDHADVISRYGPKNLVVVPNAVRIPEESLTRKTGGPFTLFFVGVMNYYPNIDAVNYLCSEIVPHLRKLTDRPFRVVIAGRGSDDVRDLVHEPAATVLGPVLDLSEYYREADVVVVPLRAGGGTRIKILEAFSYKRPVVSTTLGADGLAVSHSSEILLADSPADFASNCALIMREPKLAQAMAERAYQWVRRNHSLDTVKAILKRRRNFTRR